VKRAEEPSWRELIGRLQAAPNDGGAWQELSRRLELLARRVLGGKQQLGPDSADDLAQQTLAKLLESDSTLQRIDAAGSPEAYFQVALRNAARDLARRKVLAVRALHYLAKQKPLVLARHREDERLERVLKAVALLNADQQQLLHLRFWEDLPLGKIAARRGKSYSAVAVELFRILERLREQLRG
jgi:RNA polymerase sigma factor (sigma-70 family)